MNTKILFSSALVLMLTFSHLFAQPDFNKSKDLLIAQFDSKPDPDDIHAQAALGCMLAHSDLNSVNYYAVAGAYGMQNSGFIDSDALFDMAFGSGNWTDADANWSASVNNIKNKVIPILQNGGRVWVQEAGQSNITADWIAAVLNTVAASTVKNNVMVVQHSEWNQNQTTPADLNYVKSKATYYYIDDGNAPWNANWGDHGPYSTPEYRSTNTQFLIRAKNSRNAHAKALWIEADRVVQANGHLPSHSVITTGGVDFSDIVEDWFLLKIGAAADNVSKFWDRYVTNLVTPGNNTIAFVNTPTSVVTGANLVINVAYEAATQNEVVAVVSGPTGTWLANDVEPVSAGTGTKTLTVGQGTGWAVANGYKLTIAIRPVGSGMGSALDTKTTTFNIVSDNNPVPVTGVTVSPTAYTLTSAGATVDLNETVLPTNASNKSVTWSTSNASVATVNGNGVVTAIADGAGQPVTITVTTVDQGKTATCAITVNISNPNPSNAVQNPGFDNNLTSWAGWGTREIVSESGNNVVKVTGAASLVQVVNVQANTEYTLTAKAKVASGGSVLLGVKEYGGAEKNSTITSTSYTNPSITFTTGASNTTAKIYFYVSGAGNVAYGDDFSVSSGTVVPVPPTEVTLNKTTLSLEPTNNETLIATVFPANASNKSVTWGTSQASVATVNNGIVTAVAEGEAIITVTTVDQGLTANCTVTVSSSPATNLVQNPGFDNNLTSWAGWGTREVVAESGNNVVKVTGAASLIQVVNVQPNTNYSLSVMGKVTSGSSVLLGVKDFGGTQTSTSITSTNYSAANVNFTSGATNTTAKIYYYVSGAGSIAYGDDFRVTGGFKAGELISSSDAEHTVAIYPNPFTDNLSLKLPENHSYYQLHLIDISGKQVLSQEITNKSIVEMDRSELIDADNGIYFIQLQGVQSSKTIKIIKTGN